MIDDLIEDEQKTSKATIHTEREREILSKSHNENLEKCNNEHDSTRTRYIDFIPKWLEQMRKLNEKQHSIREMLEISDLRFC